jgi:hypothetical protein
MRTDRQTDRHDEDNSHFSQFCERAKKMELTRDVVWPCDVDRLQEFFSHFSNLVPSIQLTKETESNSVIPFPDLLVIKKVSYSLPWFTENSVTPAATLTMNHDHPAHVKRRAVQNLQSKGITVCQEWQNLFNKIDNEVFTLLECYAALIGS